MSKKVFVLDEIVVRPGGAAAYRDAYMNGYAPRARERGMTLEHVRITPPFEYAEGSNTLHFLWSAPDLDGWWAMRIGGVGGRPLDTSGLDNADYWVQTEHMIVTRRRDIFVDYQEGSAL